MGKRPLIYLLAWFSLFNDGTFREDFNSLNNNWMVSEGTAPGDTNTNDSRFLSDNVQIVDGVLRLTVFQKDDNEVAQSFGGEIVSVQDFGYGTYSMRMRASTTSDTPYGEGSAVSGSVSAAFLYVPQAVTEIDVEFESVRSDVTHLLTWEGDARDNQHTTLMLDGESPHDAFYIYKFVWKEDSVTFYRNDELIAYHDTVVPIEEGRMIFNHWGTNSEWWGGETTDGIRYVYVDWFEYEPLGD